MRTWVDFYDYYNFDHILYFDSFPELAGMIKNTNYADVSARMKAANEQRKKAILQEWTGILSKIKK
jgi:hypothetical protein